ENGGITGIGCGAMQLCKALRVLLIGVQIENDFRPNPLQGWLQFCRAEPDHGLFPAPPSRIALLDSPLALKAGQKGKGALARNDVVEGKAGENIEPRPSDLGDKRIVPDRF